MGGKAARGAAATLGAQAIKFVIQLGSLVVLARLLSPSDYGLIAMAGAFIGLANLFADFGLSMASIQSKTITQGQKSNLFWVSLLIGLVLFGLFWILAVPIADFYNDDTLVPVVQVLAALFVISSASGQFRAEVSRRLQFRSIALAEVVAQLASYALAIGLAFAGFGFWALVAQQVAFTLVQSGILVGASRWAPSLPKREPMRELFTFGANNFGTRLVNYASENTDTVVLGRFYGSDVLGLYTRAYQLFKLPLQQLAAPMTRVAFPILSKLNGTPRYDDFVERAQLLLTYLLGGLFFIAVGLSSPIIEITLGPDWDEAKGLFAVLAIGGVFQSMGYIYYWIFLSKAMTGIQLKFTIIARLIMVGLICIGVIWGSYGVAAGLTAGLAINWLILTVFAIPKTGVQVKPLVLAAIRPISCYVVMLALASPVIFWAATWDNSFAELGAVAGSMALVLGLIILTIRPVRRDLGLIVESARMIRKRKK